MPTSSVADMFSVTEPRYQLFWPVGAEGDSVATLIVGGVVSCAHDGAAGMSAAAVTQAATTDVRNLLRISVFSLLLLYGRVR
ncbi:hypothetical protein GCM10023193_44970 [Planotetraspora kaengkrachanensis]|uniref:Uncharacterized protein n=1 Tax=Planotetraspora kaengkrachanensis TaxID=575193 RepID=A0A8J3Q1Z9_9ACTN|nr:hypothetical protein Pka01_81840 [Planotetraspora kaengkrachanensis]